MQVITCQQAFAERQAFSQNYPRTEGAYKLAERRAQWEECEHEVARIARTVDYPSLRFNLLHCTYEDRHIWLGRIPIFYAHQLSADIIPSYRALIGDGMSQAAINLYLPQVERRCRDVLQELERARLSIKPISREYQRMQEGESAVGDALVRARYVLEDIIDLTPPEIRSRIYPPAEALIENN